MTNATPDTINEICSSACSFIYVSTLFIYLSTYPSNSPSIINLLT